MAPTDSIAAIGRVAELLVSAAAELSGAAPTPAQLAPMGVPVRRGRMYIGRFRDRLQAEALTAVAGFATAIWLGPVSGVPTFGGLSYRAAVSVDARGRAHLDRRVRSWLAVGDPHAFDVVVVPDADDVGVWVVPVEDFARRWSAISP